jgi:hypothetical protein
LRAAGETGGTGCTWYPKKKFKRKKRQRLTGRRTGKLVEFSGALKLKSRSGREV